MNSINKKKAPAVYRPLPPPRVLQAQRATPQNSQTPRTPGPPVAVPAYRPEARKIVQPKVISIQRKLPTAPPVYRPEQKRIVQPGMTRAIGTSKQTKPPSVARAQGKGPAIYRPAETRTAQPKLAPVAPAVSSAKPLMARGISASQRTPMAIQKKSSPQPAKLRCGVQPVVHPSRSPGKPGNRSHPRKGGVIQGVFTYDRKQIREITPVIVSLFQGSTGFLGTLRDYQTKHHNHQESFDLMQWFYAEIERRGWNDHDITKKGELQISLSEFIGKVIDGAYDAVYQPHPHEIPKRSSRDYREPSRIEKVKIGFIIEDSADQESVDLLKQAFVQVRTFRKQFKNAFQLKTLSRLKHIPKGERPKILFEDYQEHLSFFDNELVSLQNTLTFKTGRLVLLKDRERNHHIPVVDPHRRLVGFVTYGDATFLPVDPKEINPETRTMFIKGGSPLKEYVADSRGVPTKRYVYVEKNYYQFMQFLSTLSMEGRYQLFHKAVGLKPDLLSPGRGFAAKQVLSEIPKELNFSQLAVLHQMMGNGTQQRGLSLTSTCRVGAVFSNEGDPFREYDGVRIKIDLAKIPKSVLLLNHYTSGGVIDDLGSVKPEVRGGREKSKYDYSGSVKKNREIFLERLQVDWIDSIDLHLSGRSVSLSGCADLRPRLHEIRRVFGHDEYLEGIDAALKKVPLDNRRSENFQRGYRTGTLYLQGYQDGKAERSKRKKKDEFPFTSLAEKFMENERAAKKQSGLKRFPDVYWLGWGHGYTNQDPDDPLGVRQSQSSSLATIALSPSMCHSSSMCSSVNNNARAFSISSPSSSSSSTPVSHPTVVTTDPYSILAGEQSSNVWADSAIGQIFKGKDGNNYRLVDRRHGSFHFELQK